MSHSVGWFNIESCWIVFISLECSFTYFVKSYYTVCYRWYALLMLHIADWLFLTSTDWMKFINFLYDFCKHTSFTMDQRLENRPFMLLNWFTLCLSSAQLSLYFQVPLPFSKVIWHTRCIQNKIYDVMQWNTVLFVIKTWRVQVVFIMWYIGL